MIRKSDAMEAEIRENMRGGPGAVTVRHLFKQDEIKANARFCARLTLPPGSGIGAHRHDNEDELFYVISGAGVIEENGVATPVKPGDAVLTGQGAEHSVRNEGNEPLEMLAVIMCYE